MPGMQVKATRAATYIRDMSIREDKFVELDRLCREARKNKIDAIIVANPQVLGDDYKELVVNLNKIASADLALIIVPSQSTSMN